MDTKDKAFKILASTIKEEGEDLPEEFEEPEEVDETKEPKTKLTVKDVKQDKETDYSHTIRHGILNLSSYTMIDPTKREKFAQDLKKDATMNEYIDEQFYTKWLKTNNPHFKAGIVYSYLYIKNFNTL